MTAVIDSSLTLTWFFEYERTDATLALLDRVQQSGAVVPSLWRLEVANALQMGIRRGRIDAAYRDASLLDLSALDITVDPEGDGFAWSTTLRLADRFRLTLYDAAYLELAQRLGLPLARVDQALRAAAGTLGVPLLGMAGDAGKT